MTFPLLFEVYKPKEDSNQRAVPTKPEIAAMLLESMVLNSTWYWQIAYMERV